MSTTESIACAILRARVTELEQVRRILNETIDAALIRVERDELELAKDGYLAKRLEEARAQLPDWEKLWSEEKDRADALTKRNAKLAEALEGVMRSYRCDMTEADVPALVKARIVLRDVTK